ncbi:hypothetical protein O9G_000566 [Rozella allomycis CSF55]|uniref:NTF2 domain-containing protein n=1 Tax=Rozella allomycis (strain CSF55) TaxID=988480 RepID=A0A075B095_ROZAC|nr:hypothetical protein O9G_000566 [Rozella allomycis CSF55]|eukprot:EPZ34379.1 hypothetical protein O9G_000566 [Rozella allomycis CSF55]
MSERVEADKTVTVLVDDIKTVGEMLYIDDIRIAREEMRPLFNRRLYPKVEENTKIKNWIMQAKSVSKHTASAEFFPVNNSLKPMTPIRSKQADEHPSQYEEHPSQYEENPSQYGSENPSQYEENPSQYGSENPSQYGNENPSQYGTENPSQHEGQHSSSGEKKSDALKGLNETGNEHSEETESSKKDPSKLQPDGPQDAASAHDTGSESPNMEPIEGTGNNSTSLNDSLLSESESSTLKYQLTGIAELPFQKVQHAITTIDAQNSFPNAIHILVTGELKVDDEAVPHKFSQTFQLVQNGNSFYVHNDMFRLNYS